MVGVALVIRDTQAEEAAAEIALLCAHQCCECSLVLRQGGLEGGLNFDAKVRRESTDLEDLFIAHIGGMDSFARGLEVAHALLNESPWEQWRTERYASFDSGAGKDFESGKLSLADLHALALTQGEPKQVSGKQERYENLLNQYLQR